MGECETRTQEALVAALRARPRTPYRAAQCVLGAKASLFSSLLRLPRRERRVQVPRPSSAQFLQTLEHLVTR